MNSNAHASYEDALLRAGFSLAVLSDLGFESAAATQIPKRISELRPNGLTAMRDAVLEGITLLLNLNTILVQLGTNHVWNFVHIVLTDGEDTSSKTSVDETCNLLGIINQTIPERMLKTWFIGIDLKENATAAKDMIKFCLVGQKSTEFMNVSDLEISTIFEKIIIRLGIQNSAGVIGVQKQNSNQVDLLAFEQQKVKVDVSEQRFVVLFTLDMSGSMAGTRWNKVCSSVDKFVKYLGRDDLVAAVVFNNKVQSATSNGLRPSISLYPIPTANPQPKAVYSSNYNPPKPKKLASANNYNAAPYQDFDLYSFKKKSNKCLNAFVYIFYAIIVLGVIVELLRDFDLLF